MNILFICHRIPYPPNKGEKIRSYHILKHLARQHDIYLASLIDDAADLKSLDGLSGLVRCHMHDLIPARSKKLKSGLGLLAGRPVSVGYFYSRTLQEEIDSLLDSLSVDAAVCVCSPTAEYLFRSRHWVNRLRPARKIMDFIDVDSVKWRQMAAESRGPMRWVYSREAVCLERYERRVAREFDHLLVVTEAEKALLNGNGAGKSLAVGNGVDLGSFSPEQAVAERPAGPVIAFTGVMDYRPNVDGVRWFAAEVFPAIRQRFRDANFWIIGNRPTEEVKSLETGGSGVRVTGFVEDVRPYMAAADVCVAPLRIARGIQNKVLEAMAIGKPVVATTSVLNGMAGSGIAMSADDADGFARAVIRLIEEPALAADFARRGRAYVREHHDWTRNLQALDRILSA